MGPGQCFAMEASASGAIGPKFDLWLGERLGDYAEIYSGEDPIPIWRQCASNDKWSMNLPQCVWRGQEPHSQRLWKHGTKMPAFPMYSPLDIPKERLYVLCNGQRSDRERRQV